MVLPITLEFVSFPPQYYQPGDNRNRQQEEAAHINCIRTKIVAKEVVHSRLPQKDEGRGFTGEKPTGDLAAYDQVCTIPVPGGYMP